MKPAKTLALISLVALSLAFGAGHAQSASLLLDFGPTAVLPADALLSPGHFSGAVPESETTWNRITADTNTLYYGDGTPAAGVTLDLGSSQLGVDTIDFNDNGFNVNALGNVVNTGVYVGTSPVRDGMFPLGAPGTQNRAMGVRVNGLPAGTYTIYVHGRNSNTALIASLLFYAVNAPSAESYSFSVSDDTASLLNSSPAVTTGFIEGDNYGVLTVTLAAGESLFIASEGTVAAELRGFFNAIQIVPGVPVLAARVTADPTARTVLETATTTLIAGAAGNQPLYLQWRLNGTNLTESPHFIGVTSNALTLRNITTSMAGNYSLFASNALGTDLSAEALLTVNPALNTAQMSNLWNLSPGDRPYISTANSERGIAFNSTTTNLLLVSRTPTHQVVVLDALTGADKHVLDVNGVVDGTFLLNMIGVADDGAVYAANLTTAINTFGYKIYRWENDNPGVPPVLVFTGDPAVAVQPNLRWGDNFTVRGAGADTQILIAPSSGTNVVLLRTTSGLDFQTEVPPAVIAISGVPANFGNITMGLAFGSGENTFWAKAGNGLLYLIQFDLNANTGTVNQSYPATAVPGVVRGISTHPTRNFLGGVALEGPNDNVRVYDVSDLGDGPVLRDQEAFPTQNANLNATAASAFGTNYFFALNSNNGIKAFAFNASYVPPPVTIATQPANRTVMEGAWVTFQAAASSKDPLDYYWRFNGMNLTDGPDVTGATTPTLTLRNVTLAEAGGYSLLASNALGSALSSTGLLAVLPAFNTPQMSNIWNLLPEERVYLGTNYTERGLAYNPVTSNLLMVSRSPAESVVVLDSQTGAEKHFLDVTGVGGTEPGRVLGLNSIAVADDGVVFAANLTISALGMAPAFDIFRWSDDSAGIAPVKVFAGDPAGDITQPNPQPNLRWADVMAVRGAGADTQILISPGSGTNVVLLRSVSGFDFQTEIPPAVIAVSGVPSGFAQVGLAFGPGTNTFWAITGNTNLFLIEFDLEARTGTVLRSYPAADVHPSLRGISIDPTGNFLAGIAFEVSHTVRLYDISDLDRGPVLRDQEVFATFNPNTTVGGTGMTVFGGNYLFALHSNNGLKAFLIDPDYTPPVTEFSITSIVLNNGEVVLTWPSVAGSTYQVQFKDSVSVPAWTDLGDAQPGTGGPLSFTNSISSLTNRFYQVEAY